MVRATERLAQTTGAKAAVLRGNARAPALFARPTAAGCGLRFVRDAGKFPVFRPLRIARRTSANQGLAPPDGTVEKVAVV